MTGELLVWYLFLPPDWLACRGEMHMRDRAKPRGGIVAPGFAHLDLFVSAGAAQVHPQEPERHDAVRHAAADQLHRWRDRQLDLRGSAVWSQAVQCRSRSSSNQLHGLQKVHLNLRAVLSRFRYSAKQSRTPSVNVQL